MSHAIHVAVYESHDLPGIWIGHVLDIDVVSQGRSADEAREAALSAYRLCAKWDADPRYAKLPRRKPAPPEDWLRPHETVEVSA